MSAKGWAVPVAFAVVVHAGLAWVPISMPEPARTAAPMRIRLAVPRDVVEAPLPEAQSSVEGPEPAKPAERERAVRRPRAQPDRRAGARSPQPRAGSQPQVRRPVAAESVAPAAGARASAELPPLDMDPARSALARLPRIVPPAAPPASSSAGEASADGLAYAHRVRRAVEAQKRYPARARRHGQEGVVTVVVAIAPDGTLAAAPRIAASSGASALDREALRMVRAAAPFAPSGRAGALEIAMPIDFSLADL